MQLTPVYHVIRNVYKPKPQSKTVDIIIDTIFAAVEREFGISKTVLKSQNRKRPVQNAKKVAYYLLYNYTPSSLKQVGKIMGGMDHSSVIIGIQTLEDLCRYDKTYTEQLRKCELAISSVQSKYPKNKS